MSGSELRLSDLKRNLKPIVDELLDSVSKNPEDIEYLIDYALKDILYPKKRTAKDRIVHNWKHALKSEVVDPEDVPFNSEFKNSHTVKVTDDRPCDTEASDNLIKVDFSPDK
tara:strand:- start:263 stop:598 length:336 start_codon:yes stop_codon:yes gene_type:complete